MIRNGDTGRAHRTVWPRRLRNSFTPRRWNRILYQKEDETASTNRVVTPAHTRKGREKTSPWLLTSSTLLRPLKFLTRSILDPFQRWQLPSLTGCIHFGRVDRSSVYENRDQLAERAIEQGFPLFKHARSVFALKPTFPSFSLANCFLYDGRASGDWNRCRRFLVSFAIFCWLTRV